MLFNSFIFHFYSLSIYSIYIFNIFHRMCIAYSKLVEKRMEICVSFEVWCVMSADYWVLWMTFCFHVYFKYFLVGIRVSSLKSSISDTIHKLIVESKSLRVTHPVPVTSLPNLTLIIQTFKHKNDNSVYIPKIDHKKSRMRATSTSHSNQIPVNNRTSVLKIQHNPIQASIIAPQNLTNPSINQPKVTYKNKLHNQNWTNTKKNIADIECERIEKESQPARYRKGKNEKQIIQKWKAQVFYVVQF
jgi:hypothetical protein